MMCFQAYCTPCAQWKSVSQNRNAKFSISHLICHMSLPFRVQYNRGLDSSRTLNYISRQYVFSLGPNRLSASGASAHSICIAGLWVSVLYLDHSLGSAV